MGNYKINEYGEIIREDYFFSQVQGNVAQVLPSERKVWKILLLSIVTLGIYGLVLWFAISKETNISCAEDGKHTMNPWGAFLLSIITIGIYGAVWTYSLLNREANFLARHGEAKKLTGGGYLGLLFLELCLYISAMFIIQTSPELVVIALVLILAFYIITITVFCKLVWQHNQVNRTYNEMNNFVRKG